MITHEITINHPIKNLLRGKHVLILCKNNTWEYFLANKANYYPNGISRMIWWGIEWDESPVIAAIRELKEETWIQVLESELKELVTVKTIAQTNQWKLEMISYIFWYILKPGQVLYPHDDISNIVKLSYDEFIALISHMENLSWELETEENPINRTEWGKIYGFIHQRALSCDLIS